MSGFTISKWRYVQMKRVILVLVLCMVTVSLLGCQKSGVGELTKIRIASFPTEDVKEQLAHMEPLRLYLEEKLGVPVEIIVTSDYSGTIEALRAGHIEVAWLGPFSYVLAAEVADAEALVGGIRKSTGETTYNSIIVTRVDTGIETIEDLRGCTFAFLDPASTSGYLVPMNMFNEMGIDPMEDFASVIFAGSHTAVQLAVASGQVDAGADSIPSYDLMVENGAIDAETQKIIWVSDDIPPSPIAVRGDLSQEWKDKIKAAFLDPDAAKIMHAEGDMMGYAEVKDSDYDGLRAIAESLGLDLDEIK